MEVLRHYEADLAALDDMAWHALKTEAVTRLIRNKRRGWAQVFDALNEVKGYAYLKSLGCSEIAFVPRTYSQPSPDLTAMLDGQQVLCEVKTIGISDEMRAAPGELSEEFLGEKFARILEEAKAQLERFGADRARKMTYIAFHSDDSLNEYGEQYAAQLEDFVGRVPLPRVEVKVLMLPAFYGANV